MFFIRRLVRIVLLITWCFWMMLAAAVSLFFTYGKWRKVRLGAFWAHWWAKGAAWIVGLRIKVEGIIPRGAGFLVISNHLGYLDILAHASVFKLRFAPKAEIRKWPVFGWLTALGKPVWIDRKNPRMSALYAEEFKATMEHGISMLVYPEGTSTDGRHGLLPFKSTPFASALECRADILPTLLFYRERGTGFEGAWYDDTPFGAHVWRVLGGCGVDVELHVLPPAEIKDGEDRKQLALRMKESMEKRYYEIIKQ